MKREKKGEYMNAVAQFWAALWSKTSTRDQSNILDYIAFM